MNFISIDDLGFKESPTSGVCTTFALEIFPEYQVLDNTGTRCMVKGDDRVTTLCKLIKPSKCVVSFFGLCYDVLGLDTHVKNDKAYIRIHAMKR